MKKKTKKIIKIAILVTSFYLIILSFIGWFIVSGVTTTENVYYIPEVDMYITTVMMPKDKYGYIYFDKDSIPQQKKSTDYIKYRRYIDGSLCLVLNREKTDEIYIESKDNNEIPEYNSSTFKIINGDYITDSTFYTYNSNGEIEYKYPYILFYTDYRFEFITIFNTSNKPRDLTPIRQTKTINIERLKTYFKD